MFVVNSEHSKLYHRELCRPTKNVQDWENVRLALVPGWKRVNTSGIATSSRDACGQIFQSCGGTADPARCPVPRGSFRGGLEVQ